MPTLSARWIRWLQKPSRTHQPAPLEGPLPGVGLPVDSDLTSREQWVMAALFAGAAIVACFVFQPWSIRFVSRDSTFYLYLAERVASGVAPHVSAFTPQNALSVLIPGGAIYLGSWVGIGLVAATRIVSVVLFGVTVASIGLFTYRITHNRLAAALSVLAILSFTWLVLLAATSSQPKVILLLFIALTMVAVDRRRWAWAGALAAAAFLCYQPALSILPAVVLATLSERRRVTRAILIAAGFAAVVMLYEGYFLYHGAVWDQIDQAITFPGRTRVHLKGPLWTFDWALAFWAFGGGRYNFLPVLFAGTLAAWWITLLRRPKALLRSMADRPGWIFVHAATYPIAFYWLLDLEGADDLMMISSFAAVLVGVGGARLATWFMTRWPRWGPAVVGLALGIPLALIILDDRRMTRFVGTLDLQDQYELADQVRAWSDQGSTIYALGPTHLLAFNRLANWSIYSSSYAVRPTAGYYEFRHGPGVYIPDRDGVLPDIILKNAGKPEGWPEWLKDNYERITPEAFEAQRLSVWQRRPPPVR